MESYFQSLSAQELSLHIEQLKAKIEQVKAAGLALNMARGKPSSEQLKLSLPMLDVLGSSSDLTASDGTDVTNYGCLEGIPEARELFGEILGLPADQVFIGGESSLTLMYDMFAHAMIHGVMGGEPWMAQAARGPIKWICVVPGYDRHFAISESFGAQSIPVELGPDGPDMDRVEELVADPAVKGMWCVPKYSNPSGVTYSEAVVRRIASLRPAAQDFRVFWDDAYEVHDLYEKSDELANIFQLSAQAGNPDLVYGFCSTSKVTIPGAGVSALGTSKANLADLLATLKVQMIGHDKINQLRHVRFLHDMDGVRAHMARHAEILRPRFELVEQRLSERLGDKGVASWSHPRGGYFVSFDGPHGSAKRIVALAQECGVKLTAAGATWPGGKDPRDSNIRIAPTFPSLEELDQALDVFCDCVELVAAQLEQQNRAEGAR